MPTPARTSVEEIVSAGRRILEDGGIEALTLNDVARAVGVRTPSLYKRIDGRGDLIRRISNDVATELGAHLEQAGTTGDPRADLRAMARAAHEFARAHPRAYALLFLPLPEPWRADPALNVRVSAGILRVAGEVAGQSDALEAARTVVAWLNGFIAMESAGAFRLGGDVDAAFEYGIDRLIAGLTPTRLTSTPTGRRRSAR